ncbi:hypothetical protein V8C35DRAFT_117690 [Trichoderma chlorosporum]
MTYRPRNEEGMSVGLYRLWSNPDRPCLGWVPRGLRMSQYACTKGKTILDLDTYPPVHWLAGLGSISMQPARLPVPSSYQKRNVAYCYDRRSTTLITLDASLPLSRWPTSRSMVGWIWFGLLVVVRLYQAHALLFPGGDLPFEPSLLGPVVNATLIPRTILLHPPLGKPSHSY